MKKVGIFYGSSSGDTEYVAELIQQEFGAERADVKNIVMADQADLMQYEYLIFGTSTWRGAGLQADWEFYLGLLDSADFSGKKVALFGTGDQVNYPDNFVDAMRIIYDKVVANNGEVVGFVDEKSYNHRKSAAVVEGQFIGLPIDESNEYQKSLVRVQQWVQGLKKHFE
ncbi:MAG: flavodoxin [Bacteroidota bacterium]